MNDEVKPAGTICIIEVPADFPVLGVYANAFRVLKDTGDEYLLDFLTYSMVENKAVMVTRVRVGKGLLPAMRARLEVDGGPTELSFNKDIIH